MAKALGMLLIIWGHIRVNDWSNAFVYAFHIPLFFFLSGMVFSKTRYLGFGSFFRKRVKSLLIPYIFFSILTWGIWSGYSYLTHARVESYLMPLLQTFIAQGSGGFLVHNVPLWFVTCLFVVEVIYYFLSKLKDKYIIIISILMAIISYVLINYVTVFDFTLLPWSMEVAMLVIPFYAIGNLCVKKFSHKRIINIVDRHKLYSFILLLLSFVVVLFCSRYNGSISFGHSDLGRSVFVTYLGGFVGTLMFLIFCILLSLTSSNIKNNLIMQKIKWFGRNSFDAMAIHNPIKGFVCVVVGIVFQCTSFTVCHNSYYSLVAFIITLIVTVIGMCIIEWFKRNSIEGKIIANLSKKKFVRFL